MVLLFNSQKWFWPPRPFVCTSRNATHVAAELAKVRYAFDPIYICRWVAYVAVCPVVMNPIEFGLSNTRFRSATVKVP